MAIKYSSLREFIDDLKSSDRLVCRIHSANSQNREDIYANQFYENVLKWAARLQALDCPTVPVLGRMRGEMLAAYLGAIYAGKIPAFISYPSRKISGADYVTKFENYRQALRSSVIVGEAEDTWLGPSLCTVGSFDATISPPALRSTERKDDPLFYQCSSGTTGLQKTVDISEKQLFAQLRQYSSAIRVNADDRVISWLPLYHDMGLIATFFLPLLNRIPVHYLDPFEWIVNPGSLLQLIEAENGTLCWLPNFSFSLLAKAPAVSSLASMRLFINCSEPVSRESFSAFSQTHHVPQEKLSVCYALAENVFAVSQTPCGESFKTLELDREKLSRNLVEPVSSGGKEVVSCGRPLLSDTVKIEHKADEDVGEIMIRGECAVDRYLGGEILKRADWFPTGDLGFIADGELYVTGRIKDLIITCGKNIYPHEVESVVNQHAGVHPGRCVALGVAVGGTEDLLILFEPDNSYSRMSKGEIAKSIKSQVDLIFDAPFRVLAVPRGWLRKTSSGKIARLSNLEKFLKYEQRQIHVLGDSHVRMLWTADRSYISKAQNVHAHWWGVIYSGNWKNFSERLSLLLGGLSPDDTFVIEGGEPEISIVFPSADNREQAIRDAIEGYRQYIRWVRTQFSGEIAFMTGPPSNPVIRGPEKTDLQQGEIASDPETRYRLQDAFVSGMEQMCKEEQVTFINLISVFLGRERFLNPELLRDRCHLHQECQTIHFDVLDDILGLVSDKEGGQIDEQIIWDGSEDHFLVLFKAFLSEKTAAAIDFNHLVSSGVVDSRMFVSIISWLEKRLSIPVNLTAIDFSSFESAQGIYEHFVKGKRESLRL